MSLLLMVFQARSCSPTPLWSCGESSERAGPAPWSWGASVPLRIQGSGFSNTMLRATMCVFKRANWLELLRWRSADLAAGLILSSYSMGVKSSFKSSFLPARGTWGGGETLRGLCVIIGMEMLGDYQQQGSGKGLIIYHVVSINNQWAPELGSAFCNGST